MPQPPHQEPSSAATLSPTPTASFVPASTPAAPESESLHLDTRDFKPQAGDHKPRTPTIRGYEILEELGRGGMGVVYKARQEKANRLVALKMMLSGAHASVQDRLRFHMEAKAVAALSHPNIVQVYEVGETAEGFEYFSLEYVGGGTLAARLRAGRLSPTEAVAVVEALALAMQRAHDNCIVHRDLKPQNVLLQESAGSQAASGSITQNSCSTDKSQIGNSSSRTHSADARVSPKISDFGLAKRIDADDGLTRTGAIIGTPAYMAPEQAFGHTKYVGPAADIYALGAILYECLTGRPPFMGITAAETLEQVRSREPLAPRTLVKDVPRDLESICLHCLHKDPQRRYISAAALAEDLRCFREGVPISVRPVGDLERAWRWCRRNPRWAAMIATVALLLCSVTAVSVYAYFTVAAMNEEITREAELKEEQRKEADKRRKEAEDERRKADNRLDQSVEAVGLVARDARLFFDDAMVPGDNRAILLKSLIDKLEQQVNDKDAKFDEDRARMRVWMHQIISTIYAEFGQTGESRKNIEKAMALTDEWLKRKPNDPAALSHYAALLHHMGTISQRSSDYKKGDEYFTMALKIRASQEVLRNPDVERFTKGKTLTNLADTFDALKRWDESLALRQEAFERYKDAEDINGDLLENWAWTLSKAGGYQKEHEKKIAFLQDSCVKHEQLVAILTESALKKMPDKSKAASKSFIPPGGRTILIRWLKALREMGQIEYQRGDALSEQSDFNTAQMHYAAAQKHFAKLTEITQKLSTSHELASQLRLHAATFYTLGLIEKKLGQWDLAREHLNRCRLIREDLLREYPLVFPVHSKVDWLFSLVALGRHAEATKIADEIYKTDNDWNMSYRLACIYSLSVIAVEEVRRPASLTQDDVELQDVYRKKAIACMENSFARGNTDFAFVMADADLIPIRDDPRYQAVLARYQKKSMKK